MEMLEDVAAYLTLAPLAASLLVGVALAIWLNRHRVPDQPHPVRLRNHR
jgi:hypothetical protein